MAQLKRIPYLNRVIMYVGFRVILLLGMLNCLIFNPKSAGKNYSLRFRGIFDKIEEIYIHYVYRRISDCSHAPVYRNFGTKVLLNDWETKDNGWTHRLTGERTECINLGSFNYLGLMDTKDNQFAAITDTIDQYGVAFGSTSREFGVTPLHIELEKLTAQFLGVEAAFACCTGFATNAANLPAILSEKCLILSDEKNHASMILGMRLSGAQIVKYAHADVDDLESKIIEHLRANQVNGYRKFSKLFIVTEGIYSMDGTIINLNKIVELKQKYKAYLFVDDAHGVGVLGRNCRGIMDAQGVNPADIDILMGTYSKAFASNGGYIAGSKALIDYLKINSYTQYGPPMPAAAVHKAILSIKAVMDLDDTSGNMLGNEIREKARYLRSKLKVMGLNICGNDDSHIIPWVLGSIAAVSFTVRELKKRNVAVAGAIYPATPLLGARVRLNVSASHTLEDLDKVVMELKEIAYLYGLK